jgi:hypothetical protein
MTSGDSEIAREWFAEKPSHIAGQLEFGSHVRDLTAAEVVQQYLHTTNRGTDGNQPASEGRD